MTRVGQPRFFYKIVSIPQLVQRFSRPRVKHIFPSQKNAELCAMMPAAVNRYSIIPGCNVVKGFNLC